MISGFWLIGGVVPSGSRTPACSRPARYRSSQVVWSAARFWSAVGAVLSARIAVRSSSACGVAWATNSARVSVVAEALMSNWNGMNGIWKIVGTGTPNSS